MGGQEDRQRRIIYNPLLVLTYDLSSLLYQPHATVAIKIYGGGDGFQGLYPELHRDYIVQAAQTTARRPHSARQRLFCGPPQRNDFTDIFMFWLLVTRINC